jgi:hypothetical protein
MVPRKPAPGMPMRTAGLDRERALDGAMQQRGLRGEGPDRPLHEIDLSRRDLTREPRLQFGHIGPGRKHLGVQAVALVDCAMEQVDHRAGAPGRDANRPSGRGPTITGAPRIL